jgi:hypothetical protein
MATADPSRLGLGLFLDFPRRDSADHDGGSDYVGGALLTSGAFGHGGPFQTNSAPDWIAGACEEIAELSAAALSLWLHCSCGAPTTGTSLS